MTEIVAWQDPSGAFVVGEQDTAAWLATETPVDLESSR